MAISAEDLLARVAAALRRPVPSPDDSYLRSYPYLVAHVAALGRLDEGAFTAVAHLAYGWMPTVLHLHADAIAAALPCVERARQGEVLSAAEVQQVAAAVNRSVVGASKVLHFVNPARYPIWDRRVYRFYHGTPDGRPADGHFYQVNDAAAYWAYADICRQVVRLPGFATVHAAVSAQFQPLPGYAGFQVTPLRALEYVMFSAAGAVAE